MWGSKSARFTDWKPGDQLVFIVEKAIAGVAQVSGEPFISKTPVWSNGLYPHRIPLKFTHVIPREARLPLLGKVRDLITGVWGTKYGWAILNQMALIGEPARQLLAEIATRPNSLQEYLPKLDALIADAAMLRNSGPQKKRGKIAKAEEASYRSEHATKAEDTDHTRYQNALKRLGKLTGCSVWVAANDRSKTFKGKALGEDCLKLLPNLGLNKEAMGKVSLIDVIWLQQNAPVYAFEVESTTQVFSGLLRMSDLLSLVPALNVKLFIVAPKIRESKVLNELSRPTFRKIGLSDYCRFVRAEELESLLVKVEGLGGHVQPSVLDTIAVELPTELSDDVENL